MTNNRHRRVALWVAKTIARRTSPSRADLDDIRQAALLAMLDIDDYDPSRASFETLLIWRCRSAVQGEIRWLRGLPPRARRLASIDASIDAHASVPCEIYDTASDDRVRLAAIQRALEPFSAESRALFLRRYRDGETVDALAAGRGVSRQAISERLRRMLAIVQREACGALGVSVPAPHRSMSANAKRLRLRRQRRKRLADLDAVGGPR